MLFLRDIVLIKKKKMLSFLEWSGTRKALDHPEELTHNGRSEQQQPEETQAVPVPAPNAPPTQVKKKPYKLLPVSSYPRLWEVLLIANLKEADSESWRSQLCLTAIVVGM